MSPNAGALGWFVGQARPSSAHASDQSRSVSGGRPVIAHVQPQQSSGDAGASAWSWSVNESDSTLATSQAGPAMAAAHQ